MSEGNVLAGATAVVQADARERDFSVVDVVPLPLGVSQTEENVADQGIAAPENA